MAQGIDLNHENRYSSSRTNMAKLSVIVFGILPMLYFPTTVNAKTPTPPAPSSQPLKTLVLDHDCKPGFEKGEFGGTGPLQNELCWKGSGDGRYYISSQGQKLILHANSEEAQVPFGDVKDYKLNTPEVKSYSSECEGAFEPPNCKITIVVEEKNTPKIVKTEINQFPDYMRVCRDPVDKAWLNEVVLPNCELTTEIMQKGTNYKLISYDNGTYDVEMTEIIENKPVITKVPGEKVKWGIKFEKNGVVYAWPISDGVIVSYEAVSIFSEVTKSRIAPPIEVIVAVGILILLGLKIGKKIEGTIKDLRSSSE